MASQLYILLGSNLGDRTKNIADARDFIRRTIGEIITASSLYLTGPWGNTSQPDFINQVIEVNTTLDPAEVLRQCLEIESSMGRKRAEKWGARLIDIDILFYDKLVINEQSLKIPHPGIPDRKFTLQPLAEIGPEFIHPILKKSISQLLNECDDPLTVTKL